MKTLDYEVYKEGGILNDRYQKIEDISEGSYGYVSLAKDVQQKKLVAIKYIFKIESDDKEDRKGERNEKTHSLCDEAACEIDILMQLGNEHKNIVQLLDHFDSYIVLEYCSGGDLYEAIKGGLVPRKTKKVTHILKQIIDAVEFVHSKGVYHRDIKPENILISNLFEWTVKLSDWGLATKDATSLDRNVGSERYMAPELFESNLDIEERKEPYSCKQIDVWSIGIVFLNTVFSKNPFSVANQSDKAFCYFAANREALFDVFSTMSLDFFQVLRYSLTIDPANRDLSKMRAELLNLSEYTLDDEYYNSLDDDLAIVDEPPYVPPSSAPAPVSLPTPASSSDEHKANEKRRASDAKEGKVKETNSQDERAKSVPKFKFQKRSHPEAKSIKYNNNNNNNTNSNFRNHYRASHNSGAKPKLIKQSRKPLGIPTPNTHINNFFDDYRRGRHNNYGNNNNNSSGNNGCNYHNGFNTRDYFTPPSVHNKYMEGILSNNQAGKRNWHSRPRRSSFSQTAGNGRLALRSPVTANHSPGKYIPPNARASYTNGTDPSMTMMHTPTYHEQFAKSDSDGSSSQDVGTGDNDDVLFTLEENDSDFVHDLDNLSLHDSGKKEQIPHELPGPMSSVMPTVHVTSDSPNQGHSRNNNGHNNSNANNNDNNNGNDNSNGNDLPELLKTPVTEHQHLFSTGNPFSGLLSPRQNNHMDGLGNSAGKRKPSASEQRQKYGVYVPPHHRKSSASKPASVNEATLSVSHNSLNYSTEFQPKQQFSGGYRHNGTRGQGFRSSSFLPSMNNDHADSTTAVQDGDIFAQTDSDALLFEDDEAITKSNRPRGRSMFGPYEIYDHTAFPMGKLRTGRKSSTFQEEAVGSLEQYKNNWLILQQQQD
ncbi:related to Serine/threonine-protein kinase KSP1 [Zygosaccharomyces bailii ISA1307]|nr:related to Serine/threonine-protein kinase KSP1 [Zygosaccharomyces bailii ISA1307]